MVLHTGERWALEAGEEPDMSYCPNCEEWVEPDWEKDEDGIFVEWCRWCNKSDLRDSEEADFFEDGGWDSEPA
jgi:hypothetical protein